MRTVNDLKTINRMIEHGRTPFIRNLGKTLKTAPSFEFEKVKEIFHSQWVKYMRLKVPISKKLPKPRPKPINVPNYLKGIYDEI